MPAQSAADTFRNIATSYGYSYDTTDIELDAVSLTSFKSSFDKRDVVLVSERIVGSDLDHLEKTYPVSVTLSNPYTESKVYRARNRDVLERHLQESEGFVKSPTRPNVWLKGNDDLLQVTAKIQSQSLEPSPGLFNSIQGSDALRVSGKDIAPTNEVAIEATIDNRQLSISQLQFNSEGHIDGVAKYTFEYEPGRRFDAVEYHDRSGRPWEYSYEVLNTSTGKWEPEKVYDERTGAYEPHRERFPYNPSSEYASKHYAISPADMNELLGPHKGFDYDKPTQRIYVESLTDLSKKNLSGYEIANSGGVGIIVDQTFKNNGGIETETPVALSIPPSGGEPGQVLIFDNLKGQTMRPGDALMDHSTLRITAVEIPSDIQKLGSEQSISAACMRFANDCVADRLKVESLMRENRAQEITGEQRVEVTNNIEALYSYSLNPQHRLTPDVARDFGAPTVEREVDNSFHQPDGNDLGRGF
jgi:hypothetical protein